MVDLSFLELSVVSDMNSDVPIFIVYQCTMKLAMKAPNDFFVTDTTRIQDFQKQIHPLYFKYNSPMKILIHLFIMNTMTHSRRSKLSW